MNLFDKFLKYLLEELDMRGLNGISEPIDSYNLNSKGRANLFYSVEKALERSYLKDS